MITQTEFENISNRLKSITEQEVTVIEDKSSLPPTLDALEDNNKTYSMMVAILFIDIRKSTYLTENSNAKSMVKIYRSFMRMAVDCVRKCDGVTRQFMGDRIMGVFKDSYDEVGNITETASSKAVNAARCMQTLLDFSLNKHLKSNVNGKVIECGIGIDYGKILVTKAGMYGVESDETKENEVSFVWVGNATNHASKYSDLTDGGELFISENAFKGLSTELKVSDWSAVTKYKGKKPFRGYSIKDFYLDYADELGIPLKIEDDNVSHKDNAEQISDGIKAIEDLQNKLIAREKELVLLEEKIKNENSRLLSERDNAVDEKNKALASKNSIQKELISEKALYYHMLVEVIENCHCSTEYIKRFKKEVLLYYIDELYRIGRDLRYDKYKTTLRVDCGLMEFYMYYKMPDKAFDTLKCMAMYADNYVSIREDIVRWAKEHTKSYELRGVIQNRLDNNEISYKNIETFEGYIKRIKEIVGY